MLFKNKFFYAFAIVLALSFSVLAVGPAYADGDAPEVEPTATEQPVEEVGAPVMDGAETPAPAETEGEPPVSEEAPAEETAVPASEETLLGNLPEGTDVVVLNEEGEAVPLASQEAANAIIVGDPIWCPATVAVPTPGLNGCSASYATFQALLADPTFLAGGKDGIIWIASNYNGADNSAVYLNGNALPNLQNFKLTFQGGWCDGTDMTCVGLIDPTKPSTFDQQIQIINWKNDITLKNITVSGVATHGIYLENNTGKITFVNVKSNNNTGANGFGVYINQQSNINDINITQSQFNGNSRYGLLIYTNGLVTLKDVIADNNQQYGAYINNAYSTNVKGVTISGTNNSFSNTTNTGTGLYLETRGAVNLSNITANFNNGSNGAFIYNTSPLNAPVTITGTNQFSNNNGTGLYIRSSGTVTINNVQADWNGGSYGADIRNDNGVGAVNLTGANSFSSNTNIGLYIYSRGAITLNNITASSNANGDGAYIDNQSAATPQLVKLTGTNNFSTNVLGTGLFVNSRGAISINSIVANSNGYTNVRLTNDYFGSTDGVTITGGTHLIPNEFSYSVNGYGLEIDSRGVVVVNNFNANGNKGTGIDINTTQAIAPRSVSLTGTNNQANDNDFGGVYINASGAITVSNLTTNLNTGLREGTALISTWNVNKPQSVTLTGTNVFNNNSRTGLKIETYGAVLANNITANGSTGGNGADINNVSSNLTPFNVTLTGENTFNGNNQTNLNISSEGNITISTLTANNSVNGYGAYLSTSEYSNGGTGNVTLTGLNNELSGNFYNNLYISSRGSVAIKDLTANDSDTTGVYINIVNAAPKSVTMTGTNVISNNASDGLVIYSNGTITLNNITATNNGIVNTSGSGAVLSNFGLTTPAKITLTGTNVFTGNYSNGLDIVSSGAIEVNNLTASGNLFGYGAYLNNMGAVGYHSIVIKGYATFDNNKYGNLDISASGPVTLSNITSTNSSGTGVSIINESDIAKPQAVTLTGTNVFTGNKYYGLSVASYGAVTLSNITASTNGMGSFYDGVYVDNHDGFTPSAVTLTGTNVFSGNTNAGLFVYSLGTITLGSNITASGNAGEGVLLNNDLEGATGNVILAGKSTFDANGRQNLWVASRGTITASNLNSENSGSTDESVYLDNSNSLTPKAVTITGGTLLAPNLFKDNAGTGLEILSKGAVTLNNIKADSNLGTGVFIDNTEGPTATPSGVTLNGFNIFYANAVGLSISSKGAVVTNNLNVEINTGPDGVIIDTSLGTNGSVTLKGTAAAPNTFVNNTNGDGLEIIASGLVTLNQVSSTGNDRGVYIDNTSGVAKPGVVIAGTNVFSNNTAGMGIQIFTAGTVTANNITANSNFNRGMDINAGTGKITFTGTNQFNANGAVGLDIESTGIITLNNITASNNTNGQGMRLVNNPGGVTATVTLTGVNTFNGNALNNILINSGGAVTMTKVTADSNNNMSNLSGMDITAGGNITITCGSFSNNDLYGIRFNNFNFIATLIGVTTTGNANGATLINGGSGSIVTNPVCPLP